MSASREKIIPLSKELIDESIIKSDIMINSIIGDIRSCVDGNLLNTLNCEANQLMKKMRKSIDDLRLYAKEQADPHESLTILSQADKHQGQLVKNQAGLKMAVLSSQKAIHQDNKRELLSCETSARQRLKNHSLVSSASGITDNLLTISRTMASQVAQSENTLQTLINSSAVVTETREELKGMGAHILNSKKLLTKYNRRELTDKVLLFIAFVFFFACALYIMKKRLF